MIMFVIRTESITEKKVLLKCMSEVLIQSLNCERVEDGHYQTKSRCKRNQDQEFSALINVHFKLWNNLRAWFMGLICDFKESYHLCTFLNS